MRIKNVAGAQGYGDRGLVAVKNAEASATIGRGAPMILVLNGTNDGFDVVLPSTAGAAKSNAAIWGVSTENVTTGNRSDALSFGYCPYMLVSRATRGASTDSWASGASVAAFAVMSIDTLVNAFATAAATNATNVNAGVIMVDTLASYASSASATSDTRTALTTSARGFVRFL